ncbi:MAG: hypothetical protein RLO52_17800 [Sandaracinaceae bacterium]
MRRAWLCFLLVLPGCLGTETGNPPAAPAALTARSSDPSISIGEGDGTRVEAAWISLGPIRVREGVACDRLRAAPIAEPRVIDLVRGELGTLDAAEGCGLHVGLAQATEGPPELAGLVLFARGVRADGAPFTAQVAMDHGVDLESMGPLVLSEAQSVLLTFDVAAWLVGLEAAVPDPDGVIRIGPDDAGLDGALLRSVDLFEDTDGDGSLDPAEVAAGPLATSHR